MPFGNPLTEIAIESAHNTLEIVARTNVETTAATPIEPLKTPAWETVRDALRYRAGWHPDPAILEATQFLFESPYARVKRDLRAYAGDCFKPGRPILEAATALMAKIHGEFKFDAAATTVTTPVMKFFDAEARRVPGFRPFHDFVPALDRTRRALRERLSAHAPGARQAAARRRRRLPCVGISIRSRQRLDRPRSDQ